ncbi:MAG TPA: hypothetical protein VNH82_01855 [Candidatus Dormibacteraeota bacterium]|nr:hypothetical protein [Candidatus Dormibacteraeota bacterium]
MTLRHLQLGAAGAALCFEAVDGATRTVVLDRRGEVEMEVRL